MDDVERLVASDAIRQLAVRYAVYLDARDLDALVCLYPEDVRAMGGRTGRKALHEDFDRSLRTVGIERAAPRQNREPANDASSANPCPRVRTPATQPILGTTGTLHYASGKPDRATNPKRG